MNKKWNLPVDYTKLKPSERKEVREQYIELQNGKCSHCGNSLTESPTDSILSKQVNSRLFPETFFNWPVHLHHSHETGLTIGAVHNFCNAVLWQYHGE